MSDDYELLPHEELEALRKEVERLKKSPYPNSKQNKNILDTMEDLNDTIKKLISIFEDAQDDIIKDYSESSPMQVLKQISDQNAKIAEGIVALANLVKGGPPTGFVKQSTPPNSEMQMQKPPMQNRTMPTPPKMNSMPSTSRLGDDFPDFNRQQNKGLFGNKK
ncbi:MAG: hypothetical protein KKF89_06020 [Nanoarchaeota archaeon]|nr:hypothetical protein [Nanoarchaeota archaeon]MBU1855255.1 hypothetical protein [Nanoarchaeota archaeon]